MQTPSWRREKEREGGRKGVKGGGGEGRLREGAVLAGQGRDLALLSPLELRGSHRSDLPTSCHAGKGDKKEQLNKYSFPLKNWPQTYHVIPIFFLSTKIISPSWHSEGEFYFPSLLGVLFKPGKSLLSSGTRRTT